MSKDPLEVRADVLRRLQTEGLEAAFEGALRVLRDPKSQSSAVATAAMMMFRANNMLDKAPDPTGGKELHEMDGEELAAYNARLRQEHASLLRERAVRVDREDQIGCEGATDHEESPFG